MLPRNVNHPNTTAVLVEVGTNRPRAELDRDHDPDLFPIYVQKPRRSNYRRHISRNRSDSQNGR